MNKKTIKLFLLDGEADGIIRGDITNSDLISYRIPKNRLKECKDIEELQFAGVYILMGEQDGKPFAYIGESENIYTRINDHAREKDFWNECLIFVRMNNGFNKGNIRYLEDALYKNACEAGRYETKNSRNTSPSPLTEAEIEEMDETVSLIELITSVRGYKIFKKLKSESEAHEEDLYYINSIGLKAKGMLVDEGFVVFAGSQSNPQFKEASKERNGLWKKWNELRENSIVNLENIFVKDTVFTSSSAAAAMVLGRDANGYDEWKDKAGTKLGEKINK